MTPDQAALLMEMFDVDQILFHEADDLEQHNPEFLEALQALRSLATETNG